MVLSVGQLRMQPVWDDETEHFMPQQQVTMVLGSDHRVVKRRPGRAILADRGSRGGDGLEWRVVNKAR